MADMSEVFKEFSSMMENNNIPDNVKELFNSMKNNVTDNSNNTINNDSNKRNENDNLGNFDINTILKIQKIMNTMKNNDNNSGANLLRSLKPYLNSKRQEKIDDYIKFFNIEKMFEILKQHGGDNLYDK